MSNQANMRPDKEQVNIYFIFHLSGFKISHEKDRARRRTKGKKRSPDTDDYDKQCLATLKRLKRVEVDLRLEKVVASKQLRLAVETEEERRTRLEAFLKSWQLC